MFNIEEFDIKLDTKYIGRNFLYSEEVESTNSFLLHNKEYKENGTVLFSEYQSHGRGRRERTWISESGLNLSFSILLTKRLKGSVLNLTNLGASVAVAQAIENLHQLDIKLKWPNDILVGHRKISGILSESVSQGDKIERAVIGIGINVNQPNFLGKFDIPPTSIKHELSRVISREKLLSETLNIFEEIYEQLYSNPDKVLDEWRSRCKMIGDKVKIIDDDKRDFGLFIDIDSDGALLLKQGDEIKRIFSGDISLR